MHALPEKDSFELVFDRAKFKRHRRLHTSCHMKSLLLGLESVSGKSVLVLDICDSDPKQIHLGSEYPKHEQRWALPKRSQPIPHFGWVGTQAF